MSPPSVDLKICEVAMISTALATAPAAPVAPVKDNENEKYFVKVLPSTSMVILISPDFVVKEVVALNVITHAVEPLPVTDAVQPVIPVEISDAFPITAVPPMLVIFAET